jgi:hypothetical protein
LTEQLNVGDRVRVDWPQGDVGTIARIYRWTKLQRKTVYVVDLDRPDDVPYYRKSYFKEQLTKENNER